MIDAGVEFESPHAQVEDTAATLEEWADLDITFDQPDPPEPSAEPGQDAGDADEYSEHWFLQSENGTCVPASVAQIVAENTGEDVRSEDAFVSMAQENGYFAGGDVSGGMSIYAAADLLERSGIPASVETGTMSDLSTALEEGRGVLLYVDSGEYWDPEQEERDEARGRDEGGDPLLETGDTRPDDAIDWATERPWLLLPLLLRGE
jgi:hypothetical protein